MNLRGYLVQLCYTDEDSGEVAHLQAPLTRGAVSNLLLHWCRYSASC